MRSISIFGDSISTFGGTQPAGFAVFYGSGRHDDLDVRCVEQTWWAQVIEAMDAKLLVNAAWSGSMVEGAGFPAGESPERIEALARNGQAPDDILVYYGTNDYGWGSAQAQAAGRSAHTPFCLAEQGLLPEEAIAGLAPQDAAARFGAAYGRMLSQMHSRFPAAHIWCLTLAPGRVHGFERSTFPRMYRGISWEAYNEAIRDVAREHEACICDIAACGFDYDAVEGTHPTALGMRQLAWMTLHCMSEAGETVDVADEFPGGDAYRSDDPCDEPGRPCVGCPHALATGNQWMNVCLRRGQAD